MALNERAEQFAALYTAGLKLMDDGKDDEAMAKMWEAAQLAPEGWLSIAIQLTKDGQTEPALARFHEVLHLTRNAAVRAAAFNNIGMIHAARSELDVAEKNFRAAHSEWPSQPDALSNLALLDQWRGDYPAAIRTANRALAFDPWHEQASFIRAMVKLLAGNYKEGWEEYECRWRSKGNGLRKVEPDCPEWDGTNGKRVYIYGEQGAGDSILSLRYARLIHERGVHQTWVTQKGMAPLLRLMPEIDRVLDVGEPTNNYDCHIPSVSLPRVFKTTLETIPPAPYLLPPSYPAHYGPGFQVGIVWRGSTAQNNDKFRSTNLESWKPVLDLDGITFHSLQVDGAEEGLLYPQLVQHSKPADWVETARRVGAMDCVVSVDTSVVHLCGALGVPCLVAMHKRPYFVFPPSYGDKTPWYDSVKLFRCERDLDWKPVFERIANELREKFL